MPSWLSNLGKLSRNLRRNRQKLDLRLETWRSHRLTRDETSVVIVRLDGIGDFVLWLDCARAIRRRYPRPDFHITLVIASELATFAASTGLFDNILSVDRQAYIWNNKYNRSILRRVADLRAAVAISPCISRDRHGDRLILVSGATTRIGVDGDESQTAKKKAQSDLWYTDLIKVPPGIHEIEANAIVARYFDKGAAITRPRMHDAMVTQPEWLPLQQKYFVIFPGSASHKKKWPVERFASLVERLQAQFGWTAILCGSPSDQASITALMNLVPSDRVIDACGRTTLSDLAGVLKGAQLLICNDTGAAHIAAAVDCPVVVPFGGWQIGRFLPYPQTLREDEHGIVFPVTYEMPCFNCNWKCIFPRVIDGPLPCVSAVTTDAVWAVVQSAINDRPMDSLAV